MCTSSSGRGTRYDASGARRPRPSPTRHWSRAKEQVVFRGRPLEASGRLCLRHLAMSCRLPTMRQSSTHPWTGPTLAASYRPCTQLSQTAEEAEPNPLNLHPSNKSSLPIPADLLFHQDPADRHLQGLVPKWTRQPRVTRLLCPPTKSYRDGALCPTRK